MKRQEILSLLITFFVGLTAGAYLYLTGFAPQFSVSNNLDGSRYEQLVIVGDMYGGFRTGTPPSFQLLGDGSFRYVLAGTPGTLPYTREGNLPRALRLEVFAAISERSLSEQAREVQTPSCLSYVDGIDYRYRITLEGEEYILDTCGTNFTSTSELGQALDKLWKYFETLR